MTDHDSHSSARPTRKPSARTSFVWAVLLFAAPLLLAFVMYYGSNWRPHGTTNKGELVNPAVPLPDAELPLSAGGHTPVNWLRDKWTLLYLGNGACDAQCRYALLTTRQARQLLGKDMPRVQRAFLYSGSCCDTEYFDKEQQGLIVATLDSAAGQHLLALFPAFAGKTALTAGRIYIVDPLGNLMMSYAPATDPRDILSDMKKLLTLSHIG